ncbi:MAG: type III secretion system export apparatus subunit SctT [Gammaproteobacteria bacterium]|nr:type III secretion system export apparatus subunit SctT [Gammaproteobacteria bacterium]
MESLADFLRQVLLTLALAMPRIVGAMTALSFMGPNVLGGALARNGVAAALSLLVYPIVSVQVAEAKLSGLGLAGAAAKEFLLGMTIGSVVMVIFWCIQAVGNFIDNQRGATMASSMDPFIGEQSSPLGLFMTQSMVAVFFCTGLFNGFLGGVYHSYELWPATSFWPAIDVDVLTFFVAQFALISQMALLVGGPVVVAMFLSELGLGFISRFAPQLNVFFLSMPVKSAVASLMLVLFWGMLIVFFRETLQALDLIELFGPLFQ